MRVFFHIALTIKENEFDCTSVIMYKECFVNNYTEYIDGKLEL